MNRANRAILMLKRLKSSRVWVAKSTGNPCDVLQIQTLDTDSGSKCPLTETFSNKVTIKVNAVSLNPIDHWMVNGRGGKLRDAFQTVREPSIGDGSQIIPGRDFHGTVVSENGLKFLEGEQVIGVRHPFDTGSMSEYITISESSIYPANPNLSPSENASLPFVTSTIFSSLGISGGISALLPPVLQSLDDLKRKRCLIIGVSGGLGSILAEILAEHNAGVIDGIGNGTPNDLPLRKNLSYKDENYKSQLELDDYDLVFDAADGSAYEWVGDFMNHIDSNLISYSSPLLELIGSASLLSLPEFLKSQQTAEQTLKRAAGDGAKFRYGFFSEREQYFDIMKNFKFKPKISQEFEFDEAPRAFESMIKDKHSGKIVITL